MLARLQSKLEIARLRRAGLGMAWSVGLNGSGSLIHHGRGCQIAPGSLVWVDPTGHLTLGDDITLGNYSNVRAMGGGITIGSRVLFGQFVSLIATNHRIGPDGLVEWHEIDLERRGITIGNDCWIGVGVTILAGVVLGERCVVGAGSVVTRSFPARSRLVGSPARAL